MPPAATVDRPSPDDVLAIDPAQAAAILAGPPAAAAQLLRRLADAGVSEAQAQLGQRHLDANGVGADPVLALTLFRKAAQSGHPMAVNMVGRCYENGWGVPADPRTAAGWYRKAAALGCDWGYYNLATLLALGKGVPQDRRAAFDAFARGAARGHAKSANILGGFHEDGWETRPDIDRARDLYRRAAEGGDFRGQFNHARCLADQGQSAAARPWLALAHAGATPAFRAKMLDYLAASDDPDLRAAAAEL